MKKTALVLSFSLIALAGCDLLRSPTPTPDYTVHVMPTANGLVAIPPECPPWTGTQADPYDNQPEPQFGCANARNLALMVDRPSDLVKGRDLGDSNPVMAVGAIRRYENNQTRGLVDTDTAPDMSQAVTTAPTASSPMSGDITGVAASAGGGGSSSSSSSGVSSGSASVTVP